MLSDAFPGWNLHPFPFPCGSLRPLHFRLLGCSVLQARGWLSLPFLQVRSIAHYRLWGCLSALIPDTHNTLGPHQFHLPTNCPSQLVFKWGQPSVYSVSLRSCCNSFNTSMIPSLIGRNMFFFHPAKSIHLLDYFLNSGNVFHRNQKSRTISLFCRQLSSEQLLAQILFKSFPSILFPRSAREVYGPPLQGPACRGKVWILQEVTWFAGDTVEDTTPSPYSAKSLCTGPSIRNQKTRRVACYRRNLCRTGYFKYVDKMLILLWSKTKVKFFIKWKIFIYLSKSITYPPK